MPRGFWSKSHNSGARLRKIFVAGPPFIAQKLRLRLRLQLQLQLQLN